MDLSLTEISRLQFAITAIYHFAAQAGVRYSILHPRKYLDSNIK